MYSMYYNQHTITHSVIQCRPIRAGCGSLAYGVELVWAVVLSLVCNSGGGVSAEGEPAPALVEEKETADVA